MSIVYMYVCELQSLSKCLYTLSSYLVLSSPLYVEALRWAGLPNTQGFQKEDFN
jgi:hypothetical protein